MIRYDPLWETMKKRGITTYRLTTHLGVSSGLMSRIRNGMPMNTTTLNDFCKILDCRVEDILLYVPDADNQDDGQPGGDS